jgi:uncharacterized protein YwqG
MVKFLDVKYAEFTSLYNITAEYTDEVPAKGDCIFMQAFVFNIIQVETPSPGRCRIIANTETAFLNDMDELIDDWKGNTFFCGENKEVYQAMSNPLKVRYITKLALKTLPETAIDYVREHIEVCLAMFPTSNAPRKSMTKIGGLPAASKGFTFPIDKNGRSALFIGQLNLAELDLESIQGLPASGMLYFFGTTKVTYENYHSLDEILVSYERESFDAETVALPDDISEYGFFAEKGLLIQGEISLPPDESTQELSWDFEDEELDAYNNFREIVNEYGLFDPPEGNYYDRMKFMGHPQQLNGCVLIENVLKYSKLGWYSSDQQQREKILEITTAMREEAREWRHLFSFSVDELRDLSNFEGFQEYLDGFFNVLIKKTDLKNLDFGNVRTVYQQTR